MPPTASIRRSRRSSDSYWVTSIGGIDDLVLKLAAQGFQRLCAARGQAQPPPFLEQQAGHLVADSRRSADDDGFLSFRHIDGLVVSYLIYYRRRVFVTKQPLFFLRSSPLLS